MKRLIRKIIRFIRRKLRPAPKGVSPPIATNIRAARAIYDFSEELTYESIPETAIHDAKRLLLNGVASSLLGRQRQENESLLDPLAITKNSGPCTVFGHSYGVKFTDAVFLNAVHAQVYDSNDGQARGASHFGRVLIPALCAVAEQKQVSGKELLAAIVFGYEVSHRVYVKYRRNRPDGIGVAAAISKLLKLPLEQFTNAIYLAEQHGPIVYPGPRNIDTSANHICNAFLARGAVEATFLAQAGITANPMGTQLFLEKDLPGGQQEFPFLIGDVYIKPYSVCRFLHNSIEIILSLKQSHPNLVNDIERIEVELGKGANFVRKFVSPDAYYKSAQFSIPYNVACALLYGEVNHQQFEQPYISNKKVQELQRKVLVQLNPDDNLHRLGSGAYPTTMTIFLKDGCHIRREKIYPKGSAQNPFSDQELIDQFYSWADGAITEDRKEQCVDMVFNLENVGDVGELMSCLRSEPV
ncbi:MAG: MmgE/PrpD family protein [Cyanobacteria bacterium P01_D01_bin.73]